MYGHSCILLPTNEVLVVGSVVLPCKSAALYSIEKNSWEKFDDVNNNRRGSTMVNLNGRVFIMGGGIYPESQIVEEYLYQTKSWVSLSTKPITSPYYSSALALPSQLFNLRPEECKGIA